MNSDSSPSSRASSPDMDAMFLREHLPSHHFHLLHPHLNHLHHQQQHHPVSSSTQTSKMSESKSASSSSSSVESSNGGGGNKLKLKKQVTEEEMYQLRLKINGRERKRMHDLNLAMDGLREVMPYAHGPSVRKLSKIATLLLARNYILMLNSSLDEMKRLLGEIYGSQHSAFHCGGGGGGGAVAHHPGAAAAAAQQVHPLMGGGGLSSSATCAASSALPALASVRGPHAMLKGSPPALQLGSGFQHWAGLPCPCAICQVPPPGAVAAPAPAPAAPAAAAPPPPPPPPHVPITSSGLTRLTGEAKDAMK